MTQPALVLIDLDGTLIDSVPDLAYSVDTTMRELGLPERGEAAVRNWVGNGVERLVERALLNAVDGEPDAADFERALPVFLRIYQDNTSQRSRLYPGVREGLDAFRAMGLRLGCVTNKAMRFTEPLLREKGLYDDFELVVAGDSTAEKKPHPGPLLHAAGVLDVEPRDCLMIGDSKSDVQAARAAGFAVVCMRYGYNHGRDIAEENPDGVFDRIDEIPAWLGGWRATA